MNIQYFEIKKMPLLIIDDFFTDDESKLILNELIEKHDDFLSADGIENGSAWDLDDNGKKIYRKKASGCVLDRFFYGCREKSKILTINRKLFFPEFIDFIANIHYFFNYIKHSNLDATLLHYYENAGYYKFHYDRATITALSWHFFEPKRFSGGNLIVDPDENFSIECINKRMVILPSILPHSVKEVFIDDEYTNKKLGRYSMAQFIFLNDEDKE